MKEGKEIHPATRAEWRSTQLGPVRCDDIELDVLVRKLAEGGGAHPEPYYNVNAHALNLALRDPAFAAVLNESAITFCDGFGILLLDRFFGKGVLQHRATPPDFIDRVYEALHRKGGSVFLLGDEEPNVAAYAEKVNRAFPGVVAGWHHGFFKWDSSEEDQVLDKINKIEPDLLLMGMGMPRQEFWVHKNLSKLRCKKTLSVGALFAWGLSDRRRGPRWATDHGFEWLFRLCLEPGRVWKRYLVGLPEVVVRLLFYRSNS